MLPNVNGRVYVLECVLWYESGKHNTVQINIWMLPGIVRQARTNLGELIYARTGSVYDVWCASRLGVLGFRGVLFTWNPGHASWNREHIIPFLLTKQTSTHTCHTAIFNVHELHGHTLDISLGACGLRSSTQVSLWESCYGELGQSRVTNKVWCGCDGDF